MKSLCCSLCAILLLCLQKMKRLVNEDTVMQECKKPRVDSGNHHVHTMIKNLSCLSPADLAMLINEASELFSQHCQELVRVVPPDFWKLVASHLTLKNLLSLGCVSQNISQIVNQVCQEKYSHLAMSYPHFWQKFTSSKKLDLRARASAPSPPSLALAHLQDFTKLEELRLPKTHDYLFPLSSFPHLRILSCSSSSLIGSAPNLTSLTIDSLKTSEILSNFPNLRDLNVCELIMKSTGKLPETLESLLVRKVSNSKMFEKDLKSLTNLRSLELPNFSPVLNNLTNLEHLGLKITSHFDTENLAPVFFRIKSLKFHTRHSEPVHFPEQMTQLTKLDVGWSKDFDDSCLEYLENMTSLKHVLLPPRDLFHTNLQEFSGWVAPDLSAFTALTVLKLKTPTSLPDTLTNLKVLSMPIIQFQEITNFTNLVSLGVIDGETSEEELRRFPYMTRVKRWPCPKPKYDLDFVEEVTGLLSINNCSWEKEPTSDFSSEEC
eukprot:TRINITY_DN5386_c0_g1_i1.p1 TRINITY_DN5386_c0_g1~~TRINITY_DN5386_c0_g1_i1.p1  ORF type:complete len:491 (-),score=72.09 TRINITY_DN5386_c0_g1_i1:208-1680(-)